MSSGCLSWQRRPTSPPPVAIPVLALDEERRADILAEGLVYASLAALTTPFVTPLHDASATVPDASAQGYSVMRLRSRPDPSARASTSRPTSRRPSQASEVSLSAARTASDESQGASLAELLSASGSAATEAPPPNMPSMARQTASEQEDAARLCTRAGKQAALGALGSVLGPSSILGAFAPPQPAPKEEASHANLPPEPRTPEAAGLRVAGLQQPPTPQVELLSSRLAGNLEFGSLPQAQPLALLAPGADLASRAPATPRRDPPSDSSDSEAFSLPPPRRRRRDTDGPSPVWRARDCAAAYAADSREAFRLSRLVRDRDPGAAWAVLCARLRTARLEPVRCRGCEGPGSLFAALSCALWGGPGHAVALRAAAVDYMARHPGDFRGFLGADWERYLRGMATASVPGDELALRALADAYGVNVSVVTAEKSQWVLRYAPRQTLSDREVFLLWHGGAVPIYMMLRRESAWTTLCASLTGQSGGWLRKDAVHPDALDGHAL